MKALTIKQHEYYKFKNYDLIHNSASYMITLDTILMTLGISAFVLLIGLLIYSIYDFNEERKSNEIEDFSTLISDDDTDSHMI